MVYYYFSSKDGLYRSIRRESQQIRNAKIAEAARAKGTPLERLRGVLEAWAGVGDDPALRDLRLFFSRELFGLDSDTYAKARRGVGPALPPDAEGHHSRRHRLRRLRPVRVEMAVLAIRGILTTFSRRAALGAPVTLEEGVDQVMDTFVYGLAVRADTSPTATVTRHRRRLEHREFAPSSHPRREARAWLPRRASMAEGARKALHPAVTCGSDRTRSRIDGRARGTLICGRLTSVRFQSSHWRGSHARHQRQVLHRRRG